MFDQSALTCYTFLIRRMMMKKFLFAAFVCVSVLALVVCRAEPRVAECVHDTGEIIYNPDMGFYSAVTVKMTDGGITDFSEIKKKIRKAPTLFSGEYSSDAKFPRAEVTMPAISVTMTPFAMR